MVDSGVVCKTTLTHSNMNGGKHDDAIKLSAHIKRRVSKVRLAAHLRFLSDA
jgi:hypothetical protein